MTTSSRGEIGADSSTGSAVHNNRLQLDLRTRPTRAEVGLTGDRTSRSYDQTSGKPIDVHVELPAGSVTLPCFVVTIDTDGISGVGGLARTQSPKRFTLSRRFENGTAAQSAVEADAKVLGLRQSEIDTAFASVGRGAAVTQSRDLHGLVDGWLAFDVTVNDLDDGMVQAIYEFTIDEFHNSAVDKVVHDGVFTADLTQRPSRGALGFLPHYWMATISPSFFETSRVDLLLPGEHRLQMQVDGVTSTSAVDGGADPDGVGQPYNTSIDRTTSVAAAKGLLEQQAGALGLKTSGIAAAFRGDARSQHTLTGATTDAYSLAVDVDAKLGEPGNYAANLTYRFTYR